MFTYGSLFAGGGGLDLGLGRAGWTCLWQVEKQYYRRQILAQHFPEAKRLIDIRKVSGEDVEPVTLLAGGFPCQDISNAGYRKGIENGKRSGLWTEFHRLICEIRPPIVLVENVSDLLHRGIGRVLGDLAEVGYDAEWDCIPAAFFGAPHFRARVFIIAYTTSFYEGLLLQEAQRLQEKFRREACARVSRAHWEADQPGMVGMAHRVPHKMDRVGIIGDAVVPQVAEYLGWYIKFAFRHCNQHCRWRRR